MTENTRRVAVVGGGITGLAAAFYLYRLAEERGVALSVTLLEGSERLGGRVNTLRRDGFVIERGPDSFLARKLPMVRLAEELGLSGQLTGTNPAAKKTFIARDGVLQPMPAGLNLGVPTDAESFRQTGLLSEAGKRRALEETEIPALSGDSSDETVGSFLERRFGREMVERIFEPLLAGIYAGDLYALGLQATFPQFREMERRYGSVIRGMTEQRKAAQAESAAAALTETAGHADALTARAEDADAVTATAGDADADAVTVTAGDADAVTATAGDVDAAAVTLRDAMDAAKAAAHADAKPPVDQAANLAAAVEAKAGERSVGSAFLTFRTGLSAIVEALEASLREFGCDIRLESPVVSVTMHDGHGTGSDVYRLVTKGGHTVEADAVVVALPASGIAGLLAPHVEVSAMSNIRYVSVANVVLAYDAAALGRELDGSGFLVPRGEGRLITASTWTSSKWLHTAPDGKRLIRCYVGRAGNEDHVALSDDEITAGVRRDLNVLMGIDATPDFVGITRLRRSMPQYPVGHSAAVAAFQAELADKLPGLLAAGQPFGGVGLPDCVAQGREAAETLLGSLLARE